jgi:small neutral amino acid transporter SnatA (MarC family)
VANAHQSGTIITIFLLLTTIMSLSDTFISAFGITVPKFQITSNIWLLYDSGEVTGPQ